MGEPDGKLLLVGFQPNLDTREADQSEVRVFHRVLGAARRSQRERAKGGFMETVADGFRSEHDFDFCGALHVGTARNLLRYQRNG